MKSANLQEGLAKLSLGEGLFYNKHMKMCRTLSSLWIGTLPKLQLVVDAFCASGVRGIRYKLENENVGKVEFIDRGKQSVAICKKNLKLNKINGKKGKVFFKDVNKYFVENPQFDLAELDPFGTPVPFLDSVFRAEGREKERYVSITATDTAVLCGAHEKACVSGYGAIPLDNEFCHENALRILIGKIARAAAQYDWGLEPQFCFSHRHYVKVLARIRKGAEFARKSSLEAMRYVEYCPHCLHHKLAEKFPSEKCPSCGKKMVWAGPLWGGKWAEKETVLKMMEKLAERNYIGSDSRELSNFLQKISGECEGAEFYFDLHEIASKYKCKIPQSEELILKLRKAGYFASRTHFSDKGIRTDATIKRLVEKIAD